MFYPMVINPLIMSDAGVWSTELKQLEKNILEDLSSEQRENYNKLDKDEKKIFLEAAEGMRIKELVNEPSRIRRFLDSTAGSLAASIIMFVLTGNPFGG